MSSRRVAIAGSTGSIGTQTLEFIDQSDGRFEVVALCVGSSADAVIEQAKRHRPEVVVVTDEGSRRNDVDTACWKAFGSRQQRKFDRSRPRGQSAPQDTGSRTDSRGQ